ncbi:GH92 family glycosyl hydrolase [Phytoactinopolyspora limicola]|uniref:GH92 family glycosyl hydrolase n=1 Tax=Phytoactinopolyspora limicola TaxID=2715536 RepID=UPI001A9C73CB|nr:GH92 family glycosyl hydrolase [Phytoactinopolyspora limicola]
MKRSHRRISVCLTVITAMLGGLLLGTNATAAPDPDDPPPDDGTTLFFSSFEAEDPRPDWENTAETDADGNKRMSGVTGTPQTGIPGNITDRVEEVRASGENPPNETKERLVDGDANTKWLIFESTAWVEVRLDEPAAVVHYALTSANDAPGRDPQDWTLEGSDDGETWTTLDTRSAEAFPQRFHTNEYHLDNTTEYLWYRLDITRNHGADLIQLAELQLSDGDDTPPPPTDMRTFVGDGPATGWTSRHGVGWTGAHALQYSGGQIADGRGYAYNKVFDVNIDVTQDTELSYMIFPEFTANDMNYPSTHAAIDLAFDDGSYLSELSADDHHGFTVSPQAQGASDSLWPDQWNHKRTRVGDVASGKTIERILVGYDASNGESLFKGWIDDIWIGTREPASADNPSDYVITTRGTNSSSGFSRGNTIPATAVPHGFNFWIPVTNAGSTSFVYEYHRANTAENLPAVQAFMASHQPSPWMGERQNFQLLPTADEPTTNRTARALTFRHDNEVAKPHYYGVTFENGIRAEIAPTDHAAMFRFTFTDDTSYVMFDNVNNNGGLTLDPDNGVVTGYSDVRSGLSNGATRMYVYGEFDQAVVAAEKPGGTRGDVFGHTRFDTSNDKTVTLRLATSLISIDQAKHNLELEIGDDDTFEDLVDRAQELWDDKLGIIEVEGASDDQLTTLYSNLYRMFLYPNSAYENVGTADAPEYRHAVQSSTSTPPSGPTETGADVVDGKVYVNNGFWDTYRTVWSAYSLFAADHAGELVDGFVQQYRDGGWVSRWSSPGYANLMTGTSSDVAFADAFVKGVPGIDPVDTYDAALKNATVAPPGSNPNNTNVGRKGLQTSLFNGYTSMDVSEGVSWALEGYINDYGIANQAKVMAEHPDVDDADRDRYLEEYEYFTERARNYVHMFDPNIEFFQGRRSDGAWGSSPDEFDPLEWGHNHNYTETNGWNFAFHVPHDGRGLANLYGGRDQLADKLDEFFATPETAMFPGSYGGIIHEMREARDIRLGQWGFSNQVSHHIPWMYLYAGQPSKTQEIVRNVMSRAFVGSEIGQGYAGDEDNGEVSAWYLFAALGLYPLQVGSENYVIGSPLFTKATVDLGDGRELVVNAPNNSEDNVYVQGLRVNGQPHDAAYISHDVLAEGAVLDFDMGPEPSSWATGTDAAPPSITDDDDVPRPLQDATGKDRGQATASGDADAAALFDNSSGTSATLTGDERWVQYTFRDGRKQLIRFYTLTSAAGDGDEDPRSWVLLGSNDGESWTVVDERDNEEFPWRQQTRPFKLDRPHNYSHFRIEFTDEGTATSLAEVELLTSNKVLESPISADVTSATGWPGDTVELEVTVTNDGNRPMRGEIIADVPDGWAVAPETAFFGRLASGESQTVDLEVTIGDAADPGAYPIEVTASSNLGSTTAVGDVHVVGDVIEFSPFTAAESPWIHEDGGSQRSFEAHDGFGRFMDNDTYVVYRFPARHGVGAVALTMELANQFHVRASTDGDTWTDVLVETDDVRDQGNRRNYEIPLDELDPDGDELYVWVGDSQPENGWGGWIARVILDLDAT